MHIRWVQYPSPSMHHSFHSVIPCHCSILYQSHQQFPPQKQMLIYRYPQIISLIAHFQNQNWRCFQKAKALDKIKTKTRHRQYFIIMLHNRFKLIHNPATIIIDRNQPQDSDIEQEDVTLSNAALNALENHKKRTVTSLLSTINLKGRREPQKVNVTKQEPILVEEINQDELLVNSPQSDSESESLVFIKKKSTADCLKKKLRRLATVPNIVKLERRDENTKECSICLTDLKELDEKQIGRLNCKHVFCYTCILESSKFSNRCPYCRASFSMIRHGKRTTHVQEARLNQEFDDPMDEPCYICGRNDDFERLLECEYCEYAYCHTYCDTRLNSDQPPAGHWYCLSCEELLRNQINILGGDDEIFEDSS